MSLTLTDLITIGTADEYEDEILVIANTLGLNTTSWQPGSMVRTIIAIIANALATRDTLDAKIAASGYLDLAADPSVSPEPVSGEIYGGSWLDLLAESVYDVVRKPADYATGSIRFVNSIASSHNFLPGTCHVSYNGYLYSNVESFTIPARILPGPVVDGYAIFKADVIGSAGSDIINIGSTIELVNPLVGVNTVLAATQFIPVDYETNSALVLRCRQKLSSLSSGGASNAYSYFSTNIPIEDPASIFSGLRSTPTSPATKSYVRSTYDGYVDVIVANNSGAYVAPDNYTNSSNIAISNILDDGSGLIEITTASNHGYTSGDNVYVSGVIGTTEANNTIGAPEWEIAVTGTNKFTLNGSTFTNAYVSGGTVYRVSDLDLIEKNLIAYALPVSVRLTTASAINQSVTVEYNVYVDAAFANQDLIDLINANITTFINALPIGGGTGTINYISYDALVGVIFKSSSHIREVNLLLNGSNADVSFTGYNYVAIASSIAPSTYPDVRIHPVI